MSEMVFKVNIQILSDRLEITQLDAGTPRQALKMADNLRAQGFRAWATVGEFSVDGGARLYV